METPNLKLLKKLADACRKAGIKDFEGYGFKFSLSDHVPSARSAKKEAQITASDTFDTDTLTEEQLLNWSVTEVPEAQ